MQRKRWFWRYPRLTMLGVVVLATLVVDVALGTTCRAMGIQASPRKPDWHFRERHPVLHHVFRPSVEYDAAAWGTRRYRVTTNSLGFKDARVRDVPLEKSKHRIVFLGDSFTEGIGVEYDKTFVGIVDRALQKRGIEVLNAGTYSYAPILYLRMTEHLLSVKKLEFDELVVFIDYSDIGDEVERYSFDAERNVLDATDDPFQDAFKDFLQHNTVLISWVSAVARSIRSRSKPLDTSLEASLDMCKWAFDKGEWERIGKPGLERATKHMTQLAALLEEHGIRLTIGVYPWPDQLVQGDRDNIQRTHWRDWAKKHGAGFIDCFPAFFALGEPRAAIKKHFFAGDFHWKEEGHAVIANVVLEHLRRRGD